MINPRRRSVLALLGASMLSACTAPGGLGRGRVEPLALADADPFEGGIGGTGIVGVLTGFGSLIVNGLRVETNDATRITSAFGPVAERDLAPGMALTISAARTRDGLIAQSVSVDYALVGTARHGKGGTIEVNGVEVRPEPGAIGVAEDGQRVAVSGLWSHGGLIASRFDPAPHEQDLIAGTVDHGGATGVAISGVPLMSSAQRTAAGGYVVARGAHREQAFEASALTVGRFGGASDLRQLSVEGFLEPIANAPRYRVAGLGHSFGPDLNLQPLAPLRAIYFGRYDGLFDASAGYVVPEVFDERRALLKDGFEQGFSGQIIRT